MPPLFDANGQVGCGALSSPEFRTLPDLLKGMDRLGISRSLAWHAQARDHLPAHGNARLLKEIDALGVDGERLVPSFVIAPTMLYEPGSMDELVAACASGRVRALRAFPATLRHKLVHLEPVIERVREFNPVLFVHTREMADGADVLNLAEALPDVPIVCMHAMWTQLFGQLGVLDLLRRRANILVDTSWQHCRGTVEWIAGEFGIKRILFATGVRAHNGAAVAALKHLPLSEDDKAKIAHGNLERLLGLDTTPQGPAVSAGGAGVNALWAKFRRGEPLGVRILDAHGHLGSEGLWPLPEREMEDQIPVAIATMDRLGIETSVCSGLEALLGEPIEGNRLLEQGAAPHGERFKGYLAFNPLYAKPLVAAFDAFFARDFFVGFKALCDYWKVPVDDPRFNPAYEYANRHRLPFLLHTWQGSYDSPAMLKDVVKRYPDAVFILGHSGGPDRGRREAEELAIENPNVYLEFCGSFTGTIPWEETIGRVGNDRVLFGTDAVLHDPVWELGRFVSIDLPAETLRPILGDNMRRLLAARQ